MVPSIDDNGYFMVASDGGVFAFGDAHFAGSCPGIGGCSGSAVAVMPDASGNGYWLVTSTGNVYTFGDAQYFGAPGQWHRDLRRRQPRRAGVLDPSRRRPGLPLRRRRQRRLAAHRGLRRAERRDGHLQPRRTASGYWVSSALGSVYNFGDAPNDGGMAGTHLNGAIIAATGF